MDVSLSRFRWFVPLLVISFALAGCGNRYDLSTEHGQQSAIDDANLYLSQGQCAQADAAINPLYASQYVTDQVRIIKASAQACFAGFGLLNFASAIVGATNYFSALAKSMSNTAGDSARQYLYNAVDVLTQGGSAMAGDQRSASANSYMVFLQLGVMAAVMRNYGAPDASGGKNATLSYPNGTVSNVDACALAAAFSFITDSFAHSDLTDVSSSSMVSSFNSLCTTAGLASCNVINRDRTRCDGSNQNSTVAGEVVSGVNTAW